MSSSAHPNVDLDALLDLSKFDRTDSPTPSPHMSSKPTFAGPTSGPVASALSTAQTLSGPSHNYELYRQQTGFVPGAIANTMAVNESNNTGYQEYDRLDYLGGFTSDNELFDFNTSPSQDAMSSEIMDFDSPDDSQLFTINPSSIEQRPSAASPALSPQTSNVGRLWPGAHSQAALAKAQAQQRQQQQQQQQAQVQAPAHSHAFSQPQAPRHITPQPRSRGKAPQPSDPFVEQKITQLLNSMRANPSLHGPDTPSSSSNLPRLKKEEEDMDADERLLASEEGKKLSSKERRQLRNKVSARAFRSRRKEYISQLELEVAGKVTENNDLRAQNRALLEENRRLSDLTRMLLSSPSFSNFLDHLSGTSMPAAPPPAPVVKPEIQQRPDQRNLPKDISSYGYQPTQEQIGMAMIPEQDVDFSMLAIGNGMTYQPQVFLMDTSALAAPLDIDALSGKPSNFIAQTFASDDDKVEIPIVERLVEFSPAAQPSEDGAADEEFESDPEFALFHSEPEFVPEVTPALEDGDAFCPRLDIFGGIELDKLFSRIELVDLNDNEAENGNGDGDGDGAEAEAEAEVASAMAMARVQAISARIEPLVSRLERLTREW